MKATSLLKLLGATAAILLNVILCIFAYAYFIADPPLLYTNLPFEALKTTVHAGEVVPLTVGRCNTTNKVITYRLTHSIVNVKTRDRYVLPGVEYSDILVMPGCDTLVSMINQLPDSLPAGEYQIYGTARVEGQIRDYLLVWYSTPFQVVEP